LPVNNHQVNDALSGAVANTLETMFFCEIEPPEGGPGPESLQARVDFEGTHAGSLWLRIDLSAARTMAADFLAAEQSDIEDGQAREVICELANMICGSALSRIEHNGRFRLSPPQVLDSAPAAGAPEGSRHCGRIYDGAIETVLTLDDPACQPPPKSAS
jgi:CheY-specific phosphatase CheX